MRVREAAKRERLLERRGHDLRLESLAEHDRGKSQPHTPHPDRAKQTHKCPEDVLPPGTVGRQDDTFAHELLERGDLERVREDAVVVRELDPLRAEETHHRAQCRSRRCRWWPLDCDSQASAEVST